MILKEMVKLDGLKLHRDVGAYIPHMIRIRVHVVLLGGIVNIPVIHLGQKITAQT